MSSLRVVLLTDAFPPEVRSSSHLMYELAEDLSRAGHAVTVVTCEARYNLAAIGGQQFTDRATASKTEESPQRRRERREEQEKGGVEVVRVRAPAIHNVSHLRRGIGQLLLPLAFYRAARGLPRADAILAYSPPLTVAVAAHWLGRRWRAPVVVNVQDLFPQNAIDLGALRNPALIAGFRALERYVCRHAAAISVHSAGNAGWLQRQGLDPAKLHVIPNWVDTETHRPADSNNSFRRELGLGERFVVLFAGVMGYAQDMDTIVAAAALLGDEPRVVFVLVGDGSERARVERLVSELALANVRLLPFVSREDYPALVAACNVGLVTLKPTMKTPVVPSKLATYMACGRPVIASLNPESDACELVRVAGCGLVVRPGDAEAMATAVRRLLEDPPETSALGERGRRYAVEHLARPVCTARYEALLRECAASARE